MARTSEQIDAIIAELKSNRDARDTQFENAALALDGVADIKAKKLRGFKHTNEKANDKALCVRCRVRKEEDGRFRYLLCTEFDLEDKTLELPTGTEHAKGLKTLLADESFTITGATTVENL